MSVHTAYIIDTATGDPVKVELHDDMTPDVLLDVEDQWAQPREELRAKLTTLGVPPQQWPESIHWNWGKKGLRLAFGDPGDFRVMVLRNQMVWEAAMVTLCKNHVALLAPDVAKPLVYVDYLEAAPWNWPVDKIQVRRFKAAGAVLLRVAIEQSYAKGWEGRLGLHALPQAVSFYLSQGLQFVKNDPNKQNLPYYELSAAEAFKRTGRR